MPKRFVDTELFNDEWFMNLSKDGKLLWIYFITRCDHGGILSYNEKLVKFQTGIKDVQAAIVELGDRIIEVKKGFFYLTKFIKFQYPNFPQSKVNQQQGAIKILMKFGLYDPSNETLIEDFSNSSATVHEVFMKTYGNGNVNGTDLEIKKTINYSFEYFWDSFDMKVGNREKSRKKWMSLSDSEREEVIKHIPLYKKASGQTVQETTPQLSK